MWKALVRPRGQAPAELYLPSSGAGEREAGPPQLEAAVEEQGSEADAQNYSFPANPVLGCFEPGDPRLSGEHECRPTADLSTCLGPTACSFPASALFPFLFRPLPSPCWLSAMRERGAQRPSP